MAFSDKVEQLKAQISSSVQQALSGAREEIDQKWEQSAHVVRERLSQLEAALPQALTDRDSLSWLMGDGNREETLTELRDCLAAIDRASTQSEVLVALLEQTGSYASRALFFLTREEGANGWGGHGFDDAEARIEALRFKYQASAGWKTVYEGGGAIALSQAERASVAAEMGAPAAKEAVLIPMILRDQVAAALYADRLEDRDSLDVAALQSLVYVAAQALELLAFREREETSTLRMADAGGVADESPVGSAPAVTVAPPPAPAEELEDTEALEEEELTLPGPAEEPDASVAIIDPDAAPLDTVLPGDGYAADRFDAEQEPPLFVEDAALLSDEPVVETLSGYEATTAYEETYEEPSFDLSPVDLGETPSFQAEALDGDDVPSFAPADDTATEILGGGIPASTDPAPGPGAEMPSASLYPGGQTIPQRIPTSAPPPPPPEIDVSEDATVLLPRSAPAPAPPVPAPPVPPSDPPTGESTPLVQPPVDMEGPGLAFSPRPSATSTISSASLPVDSEEPGHEEGRRLARLLVSEIRLYNEEDVEDGRRNRDIYSRLQGEIDRSRKMYEERIAAEVREARDYFTEELVRILADGDSSALGM